MFLRGIYSGITIRSKVSLTLVAVILLVAASVSMFTIREAEKALEAGMKKRGADLATNLSRLSVKPLLHNDVWELYRLIRETVVAANSSPDKIVAYVMVLNRSGEVLAHSDPRRVRVGESLRNDPLYARSIAADRLMIQQIQIPVEGIIYDISYPVYLDGEKVGLIRLGITRRNLDALLAELKAKVAVITGILSLIGVILGVILAGRVTASIRRLTDFVGDISKGKMDRKIEIEGGGEIAYLARAFDQMAVELRKRIGEITEAKEHLERLLDEERRMRLELERSRRLSDIGEFAAAMAHEIRTPLARVMMGGYALKEDSINGEERNEAVDDILKGVADLNHLVTELLNYTGKVELQKTQADIRKVLDTALFNLKEEIERGSVKVFCNLGPGLSKYACTQWREMKSVQVPCREGAEVPEVEMDPVRMEYVFNNIIKNALHAMPDGGDLTVRTSVIPSSSADYNSSGCIEISFTDTGCGIPEENLGKIFNPFFTTKSDGTGLGLALVSRVMEAHGGGVKAESKRGEGSTFRLSLPVSFKTPKVTLSGTGVSVERGVRKEK